MRLKSHMTLELLLGFGVPVVFAAFYNGFCYFRWKGVADQLGVKVAWNFHGPCGVKGTLGGVELSARVTRTYSTFREQRRVHTSTKYIAKISRGIPRGFAVRTKGMGSKIGKFFGMQDIETGIDGFDYLFVVRAKDATEGRAYVRTPGVADALLDFEGRHSGMRIARGRVKLRHQGRDSVDEVRKTIHDLVELVQTLEYATDTPAHAPDNYADKDRLHRPYRQ